MKKMRDWWKILLAAFIFLLLFYGAALLENNLEPPECVLTICKTGT
jgi:hypothetical protein